MKKFRIWLRENKQWNEEGQFRPRHLTRTVAPNHTVHIHQPTPAASTPQPHLAQTIDYTPPQSKAAPYDQSTKDFVPQHGNDYNYHDHPVVNRLLNIVKHDIDALTWDYGKDSVEHALANAIEVHPMVKAQCDKLAGCWKKFKDALYKELREGANPWWGPPRSGPPNPVLYQSLLMRFKDLEKVFEEIKKLCSECEKDELNQLFLTFMNEYSRVIPGIKAQVQVFLKNTPQRR
jgi:hypothetical protein